MKRLRSRNRETYDWLRRLDKEKWSLAHDKGYRYGIMTTNFAETYNAMIKKLRALPITSMMKMLFIQLVNLFNKHRSKNKEALLDGKVYTEACINTLHKRVTKAHGHHVDNYDISNGVMSITTAFNNSTRKGNNVQIVNLNEQKCTCGKFQQSKIPCSHAIAACMVNGIEYTQYISTYYTIEKNMQVWSSCFVPLPDSAYWPTSSYRKLLPNSEWRRKKGRPKVTRYRNEMDWGGNDGINFCSKCGKSGHNIQTCPRNNR